MLRFESYLRTPSHSGGDMRDGIEVYWKDRLIFDYSRNWHVVLFFAILIGAEIIYGIAHAQPI